MHLWGFWVVLPGPLRTQRRRYVETCGGLTLGVSLSSAKLDTPLTCIRVVELAVGVMCSSLPAFAGFFRYHLPLLRSIRSRLSSTFRSFHFPKLLNRSSDRGSTEKLASGNIKITLGSRVDGRGHFLNMTSIFGKGTQRSAVPQTATDTLESLDHSQATRRYFYEEMKSPQQAFVQYPAPTHSQPSEADIITSVRYSAEPGSAVWDNTFSSTSSPSHDDTIQRSWWRLPWRSPPRTGYWDLMSVFRSRGPNDGDEGKDLQPTLVSS